MMLLKFYKHISLTQLHSILILCEEYRGGEKPYTDSKRLVILLQLLFSFGICYITHIYSSLRKDNYIDLNL